MIDAYIEMAVKKALEKHEKENKYKVKIRNDEDTWDVNYWTSLPFVPFMGLKLHFENNRYMTGTVQSVEWKSEENTFYVVVK